MRSTALHLMLVIIQGVLVTSFAEARDDARPTLVVRTYEVTPVQTSSWSAAVGAAGTLLDHAGIHVEWVHCSSQRAGDSESGPARCTLPFARNEVVLRIVKQPMAGPRDQILLGDSMIDSSSHSGVLATVYLERVAQLADDAHVSHAIVLARTMAHELGHLVLGTNTHSRHGLMRPAWTADELSRNRAIDWIIPAAEGARMRQRLRRRIDSPVLTRMIDGCPASDSSARSHSCSKPTS